MNFKVWFLWFKSLQWSRRWFVLLILIRPFVDLFHQLKNVSPFLSPLYIIGILTPLFIIISLLSGKMKKRIPVESDYLFFIYGTIVFCNCMLFLAMFFSLDTIGDIIKSFTPILLFFYLRRFVHSRADLEGILQAFFYSCVFPFAMIIYENIINPISVQVISQNRGGGMRLQGGYADIMSYAIFIIAGAIIVSYFYVKAAAAKKKPTLKTLIVFILCVIGLVSIKHVSSWTVFLACMGTFFYYISQRKQGFIIAILVIAVVATFFAPEIYKSQIEPLINKEIAVAEGEKEAKYAFNGRMTRWGNYFSIWEEMPFYSKLFGVTTSGFEEVPVMVGLGMHSDYVRILFHSGIVGLVIYLLFLFSLFFKYRKLKIHDKYLLVASLSAILLYSVSTLPTLYMPLMYILLSIFAFFSLPVQTINQNTN